MGNTMKCPVCGREFEALKYNQLYCEKKCYIENQRMQVRKYQKDRASSEMDENRERMKRIKNARCVLAEINARARAAGMTYGQYVGKMKI